MTLTPSQAIIKPSTVDRKISWQVHKMQFTMVAKANRWSHSNKAFNLAVSVRGDIAIILERLSKMQRHDFQALLSAPELQFREKSTKECSRQQLKVPLPKMGKSLQELAMDIETFPPCIFGLPGRHTGRTSTPSLH